jgi:hypothetical protein
MNILFQMVEFLRRAVSSPYAMLMEKTANRGKVPDGRRYASGVQLFAFMFVLCPHL